MLGLFLTIPLLLSDRRSGQICIWVYLGIDDNALVELVSKIFVVAVSAVALLGFALYGGRLVQCHCCLYCTCSVTCAVFVSVALVFL